MSYVYNLVAESDTDNFYLPVYGGFYFCEVDNKIVPVIKEAEQSDGGYIITLSEVIEKGKAVNFYRYINEVDFDKTDIQNFNTGLEQLFCKYKYKELTSKRFDPIYTQFLQILRDNDGMVLVPNMMLKKQVKNVIKFLMNNYTDEVSGDFMVVTHAVIDNLVYKDTLIPNVSIDLGLFRVFVFDNVGAVDKTQLSPLFYVNTGYNNYQHVVEGEYYLKSNSVPLKKYNDAISSIIQGFKPDDTAVIELYTSYNVDIILVPTFLAGLTADSLFTRTKTTKIIDGKRYYGNIFTQKYRVTDKMVEEYVFLSVQ